MIKYRPYGVIPYNPHGPIDPDWNNAINREIDEAMLRGVLKSIDFKSMDKNSLTRLTLNGALR